MGKNSRDYLKQKLHRTEAESIPEEGSISNSQSISSLVIEDSASDRTYSSRTACVDEDLLERIERLEYSIVQFEQQVAHLESVTNRLFQIVNKSSVINGDKIAGIEANIIRIQSSLRAMNGSLSEEEAADQVVIPLSVSSKGSSRLPRGISTMQQFFPPENNLDSNKSQTADLLAKGKRPR